MKWPQSAARSLRLFLRCSAKIYILYGLAHSSTMLVLGHTSTRDAAWSVLFCAWNSLHMANDHMTHDASAGKAVDGPSQCRRGEAAHGAHPECRHGGRGGEGIASYPVLEL